MADLKIEKSMTGFKKYEDTNGNGKLDDGDKVIGSIMYAQGKDGKVKGVKLSNVSVFNPKELSDDLANRGDASTEASNEALPTDEKGNFKVKNDQEYSVNAFKTALTKMTKPATTTETSKTPGSQDQKCEIKTSFDAEEYQRILQRGTPVAEGISTGLLSAGASGYLFEQTDGTHMKIVQEQIDKLFGKSSDCEKTNSNGNGAKTSTEPAPSFVEDKTQAAPAPVVASAPVAAAAPAPKASAAKAEDKTGDKGSVKAISADCDKDHKSTYVVQADQSIDELVIMSLKAKNKDKADYKPTKEEIAKARTEFVKENGKQIRTSKCSKKQFILVGSEIKMDCDVKKPEKYLDTKAKAEAYWAKEYEGLKPGCNSAETVRTIREKNLKNMNQGTPEVKKSAEPVTSAPAAAKTEGLEAENKKLTDENVAKMEKLRSKELSEDERAKLKAAIKADNEKIASNQKVLAAANEKALAGSSKTENEPKQQETASILDTNIANKKAEAAKLETEIQISESQIKELRTIRERDGSWFNYDTNLTKVEDDLEAANRDKRFKIGNLNSELNGMTEKSQAIKEKQSKIAANTAEIKKYAGKSEPAYVALAKHYQDENQKLQAEITKLST